MGKTQTEEGLVGVGALGLQSQKESWWSSGEIAGAGSGCGFGKRNQRALPPFRAN